MDLRLVKNNFVSPSSNICAQNYHSNVSFLSKNTTDSFTRESEPHTTLFENPYSDKSCKLNYKNIDLNYAQEIECKSPSRKNNLTLIYSPKSVGTLHDKLSNKDIDVVILRSENNDETCLHFFSKDLKNNYGYGLVQDNKNSKTIEVYTKSNSNNIEGIISLTNKYAVQHYRTEHEEKSEIISYPKPENYIENFAAGNRFVLPEEGSVQYDFFMKNYQNPDPNEVIKDVKNTSNWPTLKMYLPEKDAIKYQNNYVNGFKIYNPIYNETMNIIEDIDLTKKQKFTMKHGRTACTIKFDPDKKGQIIDKLNNEPIDVFVLELHDTFDKDKVSFHFRSKDLRHEYGYVEVSTNYYAKSKMYSKDYPKEKIFGERIIVDWLENEDDEHYGGIGKLADKTEVQFCLENNIKPNIVSLAGDNSYLAHISRGKRFICPEKDSEEEQFLQEYYNTDNPNIALKKLLQESKRTGKKIDLCVWNNYLFMMYLPQNLVKEYSEAS